MYNNYQIPRSFNNSFNMPAQQMPVNSSLNNQNDRLIGGGFLGPFILGGITGGLVSPFFYGGGYGRPYNNYYYGYPPYYGPYYR